MTYITLDFQHPDTGVPCAFEWSEDRLVLNLVPCWSIIRPWNLEQEHPEAVRETEEICKQFFPCRCDNLEEANEIIKRSRYYDNGENVFCLD